MGGVAFVVAFLLLVFLRPVIVVDAAENGVASKPHGARNLDRVAVAFALLVVLNDSSLEPQSVRGFFL